MVNGFKLIGINTVILASRYLEDAVLEEHEPIRHFGRSITRPIIKKFLSSKVQRNLEILKIIFQKLERVDDFSIDFLEKGSLAKYKDITLFSDRFGYLTAHFPILGALEIKQYLDRSEMIFENLQNIEGIYSNDLLYFEASSAADLRGIFSYIDELGEFSPKVIVSLLQKTGMEFLSGDNGKKILSPMNIYPLLWRMVGRSISPLARQRIRFVSCEHVFTNIYSALLRVALSFCLKKSRGLAVTKFGHMSPECTEKAQSHLARLV